jgi:outer membrane immunogenic protein
MTMTNQLKTLLCLSALLLPSAGFAADLPTIKAPPPPPPAPMWKGFYIGLNAGGIWSNSGSTQVSTYPVSSRFTAAHPERDVFWSSLNGPLNIGSTNGFIGGAQVGYNWQPGYLNGNLVAGFEADIQGVVATGNTTRVINNIWPISTGGSVWNSLSGNGNMNFFGTVRGRVGYLAMPNLLIFGTGGLAYGNVTYSVNLSQFGYSGTGALNQSAFANDSISNVQVGWTAGGGAEWMFMPNWSTKVEYLYYDLGSADLILNSYAGPLRTGAAVGSATALWTASTINPRLTGNLVRAGVNYHFNSTPTPVVAKF